MADDKDFKNTGFNYRHIEGARRLRHEMTPEERRLWYDYLKSAPFHVYKQRPVDGYIVDFYIPSAKLIIELDGSQHFTEDGILYDTIRTDILALYHLSVLRFKNSDIRDRFHQVCKSIAECVAQQQSTLSSTARSL